MATPLKQYLANQFTSVWDVVTNTPLKGEDGHGDDPKDETPILSLKEQSEVASPRTNRCCGCGSPLSDGFDW